jgi:hypothetical protein
MIMMMMTLTMLHYHDTLVSPPDGISSLHYSIHHGAPWGQVDR